ncbi:MAG: hypothetical protein IIB89_13105, partial [Chloroflexi bacterium]|nr:hypothetical protein [Chloroflexota bacterium]
MMALDITAAQGAMTGARYIESLRDGRDVWLDGERIDDVPTHPAFSGIVNELARIYDLQHTGEFQDVMTFVSPESGNRCSVSWLISRSEDDLKKKRRNSEVWTSQSWGQLGRSPDVLAPYIISLYKSRGKLSSVKHPHCDFGENVVNYHRYCQENDLFLTHALGDPQVDRSEQPQNEQRAQREEDLALHVVEETASGASLSEERAREIALGFLSQRGWDLDSLNAVSAVTAAKSNRTDHLFIWRIGNESIAWDGAGVGEARLAVRILGDEVGGYARWLQVPEDFSRDLQNTLSVGTLLAVGSIVITVLLTFAAAVIAIARYRNGAINWRTAIVCGALADTLFAISIAT